MFNYERPGFEVDVTDNGLSVTQFESDGRKKNARSDRGWQFTYRRKKDLRGDVLFQFPALQAGIQTASTDYKHYQDADLVTIEPKQALVGVMLSTSTHRGLRYAAIVAGVGLLGGLGYLVLRQRRGRGQTGTSDAGLALPAQITPFSVVAFLQRLDRHYASRLDASGRQALQTQIRELEGVFFSGSPSTGPLDLEATARAWQKRITVQLGKSFET
jgi:hypothetical protein